MFNSKKFDELAKKLTQVMPSKLREVPTDIQKTVRSIVQNMLARMDLVTREEFDVQVKVLQRTRLKLEALEAIVAEWIGKTKEEFDEEIAKRMPVEPASHKEASAAEEPGLAEATKNKKDKKEST